MMPQSFLQVKLSFEKAQSELAKLGTGVKLWYPKRPLKVLVQEKDPYKA